MNDAMMSEILKRLDAMAAKLGEGGAFAWETMMRQAFWVNGVWALLTSILLGALAYGGSRLAMYLFKKGKEIEQSDRYAVNDVPVYVGGVLVSVGVVVLTIISITTAIDAVSHILNPQYYALVDLARTLTSK